MSEKRIKVLTISDHPLSPSGVGTQTKYIIEALLESDKFDVVSLGGAIQHPEHKPQITEEWGERWKIFPVDGYGTQDIVRSVIRNERPDILYFMTDPRFYGWLWEMESEIRSLIPMVYYHVWDNYPYPTYNKSFYESNDFIASISKVTQDIVETVAPDVKSLYVPHAVDSEFFKPLPKGQIAEFRKSFDNDHNTEGKFIFFWNNRNARRKQSGSLLFWFKDFLDEVGDDKATLIMHTDPKDGFGQDLNAIVHELGINKGQVLFSTQKVGMEQLAMFYNMADCTVNISDAEGFGLATLESLSCGTPIIVNMTGGLQEQVTDGKSWFGIGLEPDSKSIIGSQQVPFIYEDRLNGAKVKSAFRNMMYVYSAEVREQMGKAGREHVVKNYNFKTFAESWVNLMLQIHEEEGSWETRKHTNYRLLEVA
jgi:glycosyltransferase involved in cell wall biosynthesis